MTWIDDLVGACKYSIEKLLRDGVIKNWLDEGEDVPGFGRVAKTARTDDPGVLMQNLRDVMLNIIITALDFCFQGQVTFQGHKYDSWSALRASMVMAIQTFGHRGVSIKDADANLDQLRSMVDQSDIGRSSLSVDNLPEDDTVVALKTWVFDHMPQCGRLEAFLAKTNLTLPPMSQQACAQAVNRGWQEEVTSAAQTGQAANGQQK